MNDNGLFSFPLGEDRGGGSKSANCSSLQYRYQFGLIKVECNMRRLFPVAVIFSEGLSLKLRASPFRNYLKILDQAQ